MHRIILPLTVLAGTLFLLGLGTWQMQRLAWKDALIAEREAGLAMPAAPLPGNFSDADQAKAFEFRPVTVTGRFRHDLEQLYGARARANTLGHHIVTPLIPEAGPAVLVDRGWVPADKVHPASRSKGQLEDEVTISGIARYRADDRPGSFTPENEPASGRWYHYDLEAMAAALGLELSPIVVEADASANPGGLPVGGQTRIIAHQQPPAICDHLVRTGGRIDRRLYRLSTPPGAARCGDLMQ